MIKERISRILAVELDRKDFLKALGIGVVAATGVTAAVNSVVKHTNIAGNKSTNVALEYGESAYGGVAVDR